MKKLVFLIIYALFIVPTLANAHTALTSSNPTDGQVVTEDLRELVLTFAGEIESLSKMKLLKDGQEVPINVELQEKQMTGTFSTPLGNGSYVIEWSIAGEDGHLITGEIPFTVQTEQKVEQEQSTETKEPITTEKDDSKAENQAKSNQTNEQNNKQSSNSIKLIISVAVVIILGIGMLLLFGRKK
ncbi:copper resistance CopC family protein [Neobacillus sp. 179-J 1A1 HS]|uniref:copper resistance CopC family protein n=1 Tax=Neobacillus driksii TaxID=3035913 RepID=UPI0035BBDA23